MGKRYSEAPKENPVFGRRIGVVGELLFFLDNLVKSLLHAAHWRIPAQRGFQRKHVFQ